jgi:hypothetical protein
MKTLRALALVLAAPVALAFTVVSAAQPRAPAAAPVRAPVPSSARTAAPAPAPAPAPTPAATRPAPATPRVQTPAVAGWSSLDDAKASDATRRVTDWIADTQDNGTLPYMVIDKGAAALLVFDAKGKLLGASPVLIGVATGDDSSPGIGSKDLSQIGPAERTTPAGRFVSRYGRAAGGETVLWIDWSTSVALHAVVTGNRRERRLERLLSPSPADNRVTFGCVNVPTNFYEEKVRPLFRRSGGVVYVLPDTKPLETVFPGVRVTEARGGAASAARADRS